MALRECPECGQNISDAASSCPSCGYPLKQGTPRLSPPPPGETESEQTQKTDRSPTAFDQPVGIVLTIIHLVNIARIVVIFATNSSQQNIDEDAIKMTFFFLIASAFNVYAGIQIARSRHEGFDFLKSCWGWGTGLVLSVLGVVVSNYLVAAFGVATLGAVWYAAMRLSGRIAGNIEDKPDTAGGLVDERKSILFPAPSTPAPRPPTTAQPHAELSAVDYHEWVKRLDDHLAKSGLPTRSSHFRPDSLAYGFIHEMSAAEFVKSGYNQSADPGLIAGLAPPEKDSTPPAAQTVHDLPAVEAPAPLKSAIGTNTIEKLERLEALRKSGALTDEEFAAEKGRLLRRDE